MNLVLKTRLEESDLQVCFLLCVVWVCVVSPVHECTHVQEFLSTRKIQLCNRNSALLFFPVVFMHSMPPCLQIRSIRSGLMEIVPIRLLKLFSWSELELMVCGKPDIDLAILKKHTKYSGGLSLSTPTVQFLWKALESFSPEERCLFLRFVWGEVALIGCTHPLLPKC